MLLIQNHRLMLGAGKPAPFMQSPHQGGTVKHKYLVMHYTAVTRASSSINWFLNPAAKASAHLLIDRDGSITQFVEFHKMAWHAGDSRWNGLTQLNQYSIGIELVNGGRLSRSGGQWFCPVDKRLVPPEHVVHAKHKNETSVCAWHDFTEDQLEATIAVGSLLMMQYELTDVLGHDDIAPFRKSDPGPAFPMKSIRSRLLGRANEWADHYTTSTLLNIRSGPSTSAPPLVAPMPAGTHVLELKREGNWSFVEVLDTVHNTNDLEGWVATKFLTKTT